MSDPTESRREPSTCWRNDAAHIVEELFPVTDPSHWNLLLDLRGQLLAGKDWNFALDLFLAARQAMETDHYLPFYRLRRLLTAGLRLESEHAIGRTLGDLLQRKHRSLAEARKALHRELFEHGVDLPAGIPALKIVERAAV